MQAVPILKKIVFEKKNKYYRRTEALEIINTLQPDIAFYKTAFDNYIKIKDEEDLASLANKLLITIPSSEQEQAIKWRMQNVIKSSIKIPKRHGTYSSFEMSSRNTEIAQPLNNVDDLNYQKIFIEFLLEAVDLIKKDEDYQSYAIYIWDVVIKYFENLIRHKSYAPLQKLEEEIFKLKRFEGIHTLYRSLSILKSTYTNRLGKPRTYALAIKTYNEIKAKSYNNINTAADFIYVVEQIINEDIKNWVTKEGAYRFITNIKKQEDLIQKTIKSQFQYSLMKRGLRDCDIRREEQLLNDKRTDFVISYGFIGRILIELKLCKNPEVRDKKYENTLLQYIDGTNSHYGIFLVFQTTRTPTWVTTEPKMNAIYTKHIDSKKLRIIGFNCTDYPLKKVKKKPMKIKSKTIKAKSKVVKKIVKTRPTKRKSRKAFKK